MYRLHQNRGQRFGAVLLIVVVRGKSTDKVAHYGHASLSTFGIGADVGEAQWRAVLRQLIALGYLRSEGEYNTLELTPTARQVLRGEVKLLLRQPSSTPRRTKGGQGGKTGNIARGVGKLPPLPLDAQGLKRFEALKAWRAEVAREHNLPAYIVFHDSTLAEMAQLAPESLAALAQIGGVGAKKLEAYGREILRVVNG